MRLKIAFILGLTFFVIGLITLPDYGINWDTINHLPRGQVYLHYFLTGKKDFYDLPKYTSYWQKPEDLLPAKSLSSQKGTLRSYYENEAFNFNWYMNVDGAGHPPLSDIISSVFNKILFGKLRIINDIDAYRVYGVLLASALVGLVYYWTSEIYGGMSGIVASLSLALYPLFFSESHFNTEKDVPETVYWSFFLYSIWKGFTKKSWKWILFSGLFFGLALGTKLNIAFSAFVIVPWVLILMGRRVFDKENLKLYAVGVFAFVLGLIIFYSTWPFLWQDIISGTAKFLGFYKGIGAGYAFDVRFIGPLGINTYPIIWIIYTTPVVVIILTILGLFEVFTKIGKTKYATGLLIALWLIVPIVRVSFPHAGIYGGIRQIMEYVPALAMLAGIGLKYLLDILNSKIWKGVTLMITFSTFCLLAINLYKIHPNENVYFNKLIGGLAGAKAMNIPSWGNTFGAAYRQGFVWLNNNAEKDASAVFAHELMPNAPLIWIRPDIDFYNAGRSGFLRKGEYAISLTYDGTIGASYYDAYLENFITPVYQSTVDGVGVVKVWKNDEQHTKSEYKRQEQVSNILWQKTKDGILIDLKKKFNLSHLKLQYSAYGCNESITGVVKLSDDLKTWHVLPETLPTGAIPIVGEQPNGGNLYFPFLGEKTRYIEIKMNSEISCLSNTQLISVYYLPDHGN